MIRRPHHLGERRVKKTLKLLIMIHHDFVSVIYCFYEWFTRPQRVALLLCGLVTLMAVEATVFATIMFKVMKRTTAALHSLFLLRTCSRGEVRGIHNEKRVRTEHAIRHGFYWVTPKLDVGEQLSTRTTTVFPG